MVLECIAVVSTATPGSATTCSGIPTSCYNNIEPCIQFSKTTISIIHAPYICSIDVVIPRHPPPPAYQQVFLPAIELAHLQTSAAPVQSTFIAKAQRPKKSAGPQAGVTRTVQPGSQAQKKQQQQQQQQVQEEEDAGFFDALPSIATWWN